QQGSGRYYVQLGSSFDTAAKANALTNKLRVTYPTVHTHFPSGDETQYRVRIGPFNTREDARQVANELTGEGFPGVTVLPLNSTSGTSRRQPPAEQVDQIEPAPTQERDEAMSRILASLST